MRRVARGGTRFANEQVRGSHRASDAAVGNDSGRIGGDRVKSRINDSPDAGQIGAIAMALAVAGAVALFSPGGAASMAGLRPAPTTAGNSTAADSIAGAPPAAAAGSAVPVADGSSANDGRVATLEDSSSEAAAVADERDSDRTSEAAADASAADTNSAVDATSTPTAYPGSREPLPTPSVPDLPTGLTTPAAPYFSFSRPFGPELETRASRFYPYGTDAGGEYLLHHGVDIGNPDGTPILAVADGTVVYAGTDLEEQWGPQTDFYGHLVVVRHDAQAEDGTVHTLYGHLTSLLAEAGDEVLTGDVLGTVGMTGVALGPHLHLETRLVADEYGTTRNPELFLAPRDGVGTIVGRLRDLENRPLPGRAVALFEAAGAITGTWVGATTTYPGVGVNPAAGWNENFVFGDVAPGAYILSTDTDGLRATVPVTVTAGAVTIAELTVEE